MGCKRVQKCKPKKKRIDITDEWLPLEIKSSGGYLCYYWSSRYSDFPIRRIEEKYDLTEDINGSKTEPNYETCTYGDNACCNWKARSGCVNKGLEYLFFRTRDYGNCIQEWDKNYSYITGYMTLTHYTIIDRGCYHGNCYGLLGDYIKFVHPKHAVKIDKQMYKNLFGKKYPNNFRSPREFSPASVKTILNLFKGKKNFIDVFIEKTQEIDEKYNY